MRLFPSTVTTLGFILTITQVFAQATYPGGNPPPKPELTEIWSPVPPKVEPGKQLGEPPSDAIMLFNGKDLSGWESVNGGPAEWAVENGEWWTSPRPATSRPSRNSATSSCMSNG